MGDEVIIKVYAHESADWIAIDDPTTDGWLYFEDEEWDLRFGPGGYCVSSEGWVEIGEL